MSGVFAGLEIPKAFTVTTGAAEEQLIIERRDEFFARVIKKLGLRAVNNPFVESRTLAVSTQIDTFQGDDIIRTSNDWLHQLLVCDDALAMVLDRRNDYNNHRVSFFACEPTVALMRQIRNIQDVSRDL